MTVALGLVCSDGVIVASDSQGTAGNVAVHSNKVHLIDKAAAVWTAAGNTYVIEEVEQSIEHEIIRRLKQGLPTEPLKKVFADPQLDKIRGEVADVFRNAMQRSYTSPLPGYSPSSSLAASFLLLGMGASMTPYFLEIHVDGTTNWHTTRQFFAIGSGGEFATVAFSLMRHYLTGSPIPLEEGKQLAYRTIETICQVSPGGVGGPVQMATVDKDGARILAEPELNEIGDAVRSWMELERVTLRDSNGDDGPADPLPEVALD